MERIEYLVASIIGISLGLSLLELDLLILIIANTVLLGCSALIYLKGLSTTNIELSCVWSVALVPVSIAPITMFNESSMLVGIATVSSFMIFRSIAVFIYNQRIKIGTQRQTELKTISQQLDQFAKKLDEIDQTGGDSIQLDDLAEIILKTLRNERVDFSNGRILQNEEVRTLFLESFDKAEHEIDIVSPWVNRVAVNRDLLARMEKAVKRNVKIRIIYGIRGNNEVDERLARSEAVIAELQKKFQKYDGLFTARLDNTHEKLLLCDESFMAVGSYNLLSFDGKYDNANIRKEMMYYFENPEQIRKTRKMYFS